MFGARSIHRPKEKNTPYIETHWADKKDQSYQLKSSYLEEYALFKTFNEPFFRKNLLPDGPIPYRNHPEKTVPGTVIKTLIDKLVQEVQNKQKTFTDFNVLCKKDFNRRACSGLMILKCKHHPFVVKMFMENPKSFVHYTSKGIVPTFVFFMSGGINRHMIGFSRIKNLQELQTKVAQSPEWADKITFPRKWFVLPSQSRWIEIVGNNIGTQKTQSITIPGTYCIIADWIDADRQASLFNKEDKKTCMALCNHLGLAIDPNTNNFLFERGTNKIALIDTEHFLSLVGIKESVEFTSYLGWLWHLGTYCATRMFFRDKSTRNATQHYLSQTELHYETGEVSSPPSLLAALNKTGGISSPCTQITKNENQLSSVGTKPT